MWLLLNHLMRQMAVTHVARATKGKVSKQNRGKKVITQDNFGLMVNIP